MRKIVLFVLTLLIFSLTGCKDVVSEEISFMSIKNATDYASIETDARIITINDKEKSSILLGSGILNVTDEEEIIEYMLPTDYKSVIMVTNNASEDGYKSQIAGKENLGEGHFYTYVAEPGAYGGYAYRLDNQTAGYGAINIKFKITNNSDRKLALKLEFDGSKIGVLGDIMAVETSFDNYKNVYQGDNLVYLATDISTSEIDTWFWINGCIWKGAINFSKVHFTFTLVEYTNDEEMPLISELAKGLPENEWPITEN